MTDAGTKSPGTLPLEDLHRRLGARFTEVDGLNLPAAYGTGSDAGSQEYGVLREGCALVDRSWVSCLQVTGEDRRRFLNGLVTCDLGKIEPGEGAYGFLTSAQGRILSDVVVLALLDRFWLELPLGRREDVQRHLEKYIVADRVEISPLDGHVPLTVAGPRCVQGLAAVSLPAPPWGHERAEVLGYEARQVHTQGLGVPAWTLWTAVAQAPDLASALLQRDQGPSFRPVGFEALEKVRIEEGIPRWGRDFDELNFPQETGLKEAVSFEKGCYLGQEVVARIHFRGQVNRQLRYLMFAHGTLPEAGSALLYDGREAGIVTSVTLSPRHGRGVGLAMVHRRAAEPGTRLLLAHGEEAEVMATES